MVLNTHGLNFYPTNTHGQSDKLVFPNSLNFCPRLQVVNFWPIFLLVLCGLWVPPLFGWVLGYCIWYCCFGYCPIPVVVLLAFCCCLLGFSVCVAGVVHWGERFRLLPVLFVCWFSCLCLVFLFVLQVGGCCVLAPFGNCRVIELFSFN